MSDEKIETGGGRTGRTFLLNYFRRMNPNLYNRFNERVPSYLFISTGTAPMHPMYHDPRQLKVNPSDYRKFEKIQEKVQKKKAATPPVSPTETPILLFQGQPATQKKHK